MKSLISHFTILVWIISLVLGFGCAEKNLEFSSRWMQMSEQPKMTASQIEKLILSAKGGDVAAGEELYQYYTFSENGSSAVKSDFWLKWLADCGVPYAEFNYGKSMIDEKKNIQKGLEWMLKAKKDGYDAGNEVLERYQTIYGESKLFN